MNATPNIGTQLEGTLIKDGNTEGFDVEAGKIWVYPTNYTMRDYQYNIIQEALLKNTLVNLPTGLGKTFIAAVIMYNFYRWYPMGKIVFIAPTRPLVKQQIDACYNIMAIPKKVTAELTGSTIQASRSEIWQERRVFFVTPQVLQNDLDNFSDLAKKIKCLVFDEAHKAKGNHAYCEVMRKITVNYKHFRVLALSATPGSSISDVMEVVRNLLISHIELRTDESPDVAPYVFERLLQVEVVSLDGKLQEVRQQFLQILEVYTRVLVQNRVIHGNCSTLTKGKIFMTMKEYQAKNKHGRINNYADIMRNLNICITLYHGYELLIRHGLRSFLNFFQEHSDKPLLRGNAQLINIMTDLVEYLGPKLSTDVLPDGSLSESWRNTKFGHPKFYKLRDILLAHFDSIEDKSSRVIVFCEYRESVIEAYALLMQHRPVIKPRIFLGQAAMTQRQQISVIKAFVRGECNTLISTCIGEEGLDVGNVDLIVCFDMSNKSPVRMIQRMGRTGRKRQGRVIVLVTEGREQKTLEECMLQKQYMASNMLQSRELRDEMYKDNPRMVPDHISPKCQKMFITIEKAVNLKDMFSNMASNLSQEMRNVEVVDFVDRIASPLFHWNKENPLDTSSCNESINISKKLEKLRALQPFEKIGHSTHSETLVSLMQYVEAKRYNIPITQFNKISSQVSKKSKFEEKTESLSNFIQCDIRTMFFKKTESFEVTPSTQGVGVVEENAKGQEVVKQDHSSELLISALHSEISSFLLITLSEKSDCKLCDKFFYCARVNDTNENDINPRISAWIPPDLSMFEEINRDNLSKFLHASSEKENEQMWFDDSDYFQDKINVTALCEEGTLINNPRKVFSFQPPRSIKKTLKLCNIADNFGDMKFTQIKNGADSIWSDNLSGVDYKDCSSFFGLDSIENVFGHSDLKMESSDISTVEQTPTSAGVSIGDKKGSPILSSLEKVRLLRDKVNKRLFNYENDREESNRDDVHKVTKKKPKLCNLKKEQPTCFYNQKIKNENSKINLTCSDNTYVKDLVSNVQDFCDLSVFGLDLNTFGNAFDDASKTMENKPVEPKKYNLSRVISPDLFDSSPALEIKRSSDFHESKIPELEFKACDSKKITSSDRYFDLSEICDLSTFGITSADNKPLDDARHKEDIDITEVCDLHSFGFNSEAVTNESKTPDRKPTSKLSISKSKTKVLNDPLRSIKISSVVPTRTIRDEVAGNINYIVDKHVSVKNNKENEVGPVQSNAKLSLTQTMDFINQSSSILNPSSSTWIRKKKFSSLTTVKSPKLNKKKPTPFKKSKENATGTSKLDTRHAVKTENSDDEFDFAVKREPSPAKLNANLRTQNAPGRIDHRKTRRNIIKRLTDCPFIENEAELTSNEFDNESEGQSGSSQDVFEASFIDDEENPTDTSYIHAHYLQSVKSPPVRRGDFKIPLRLPDNVDVFSQEVNNVDDSYINNTERPLNSFRDKNGTCVRHKKRATSSYKNKINPICLRLSQIFKEMSSPKRRQLEFKLLSRALQVQSE